MKTPRNQGFTLIELLVVITIIAILASIAVPVYNGITIRAEQTKALSNAKQIALACKIFAIDNDGIYPDVGSSATTPPGSLDLAKYLGGTPDSPATNNFGALIGGGYLPSESIFWISKERNGSTRLTRPDDDLTSSGLGVERATCAWGYTSGADDGASASLPLVYTRSATPAEWPLVPTAEGGVWTGKIIVVSTDYSGQVIKLDSDGKAINSASKDIFTDVSIWGSPAAYTLNNN